MSARMRNPVTVLPKAMQALFALGKAAEVPGIPATIHKLVQLRASQINGCGFCVDMHARELEEMGESSRRINAVAAWRDAPFFTEQERAALALGEAMTRIADRPDPVSDEVWSAASKHFDEEAISALMVSIALINVWNRLNVAIHQEAGATA
ncbi:MAG: carboxymuconolactone decarboxylase family protein [Caulobacteraceae bacterium]